MSTIAPRRPYEDGVRTCTLRLAADRRIEECAPERCAFWELGGAVLDAGCLIDRLGIEARRPEVAGYLLHLRDRLERAQV